VQPSVGSTWLRQRAKHHATAAAAATWVCNTANSLTCILCCTCTCSSTGCCRWLLQVCWVWSPVPVKGWGHLPGEGGIRHAAPRAAGVQLLLLTVVVLVVL
jgi:hypothetical protein